MSSSDTTVESNDYLLYEREIYASAYIGAIGYGVLVAATYQCIRAIFAERRRLTFKWLPMVFILFALGTINISCTVNFDQLAWIDYRRYPGGPVRFFVEQQSRPVIVIALATSIVSLVVANSFMIYRVYALLRKVYVAVFFMTVLAGSTVVAVLHVIQSADATEQELDQAILSLSLPYVALAMSMNIIICATLLWRVVDLRPKLPITMPEEIRAKYTSLQALVVESALPYALVSIMLAILYGARNTAVNLFIPLIVQIQCIVPTLIVMRMTQGHAWSKDTIRRPASKDNISRGSGIHDISMLTISPQPLDPKDPVGLV